MNAVPCQIFKALDRCEPPRKRDEVYVDLLSVDICLVCTERDCDDYVCTMRVVVI